MEPQRTPRSVLWIAIAVIALGFALYLLRFARIAPGIEPVEPLTASSTQGERLEYAAAVTERAVESTTVTIKECVPEPLYVQIALGSSVVFKNRDDVVHVVGFSPSLSYSIPARGEVEVGGGSFKYRGLWPYTCDSSASGTLVITQEQ